MKKRMIDPIKLCEIIAPNGRGFRNLIRDKINEIITHLNGEAGECKHEYYAIRAGKKAKFDWEYPNFCPKCGAPLREVRDE